MNSNTILTRNFDKKIIHSIQAKFFSGDALKVSLVLYFFISILLFKLYQYKLYPDTISYISVAENYSSGNFSDAINGYFAPLYSWLLVPFLLAGLPSLMAIKILSLLIGAGCIYATHLLSRHFPITQQTHRILLFTSILFTIYFVYAFSTPDLLMACLLLFYLNIVLNSNYGRSLRCGILAGIVGGFGYLSKYYALPFFTVHFFVTNLFFFFKQKSVKYRYAVIKSFVLGLVVFLILSGGWVSIIGQKYDKFTITTSAKYIYSLMRPGVKGHPVGVQGFLNPANEKATSTWEDPSNLQTESWNPFKSFDDLKHQIKLSIEFITRIFIITELLSAFAFAILVGILLYMLPLRKQLFEDKLLYLFLCFGIYTGGFILVLPVERYLWINSYLLLIMGGILLPFLFNSAFFTAQRRRALFFLFWLSFTIYPLKELELENNADKDVFELSQLLKDKYEISGNIASHSNYKKPLYLAFHLNCKYYGAARDNIGGKELYKSLLTNNIEYYFVLKDNIKEFYSLMEEYPPLGKFEEITRGQIPGLQIFHIDSIKENASP